MMFVNQESVKFACKSLEFAGLVEDFLFLAAILSAFLFIIFIWLQAKRLPLVSNFIANN